MNKYKLAIQKILEGTGITINGKNPWDIKVNNENFYQRVLTEGEMGFGESYMDGWWDCKEMDEMFSRIYKAGLESKIKKRFKTYFLDYS